MAGLFARRIFVLYRGIFQTEQACWSQYDRYNAKIGKSTKPYNGDLWLVRSEVGFSRKQHPSQWFLKLWPFNKVPHIVMALNHKIILLLFYNCNFSTISMSHKVNIWYAGYLRCDPCEKLVQSPKWSWPIS